MIKIGTIDRFEQGVDSYFAIIELDNRELLIIEKSLLPKDSKEGDRLILDEFNNISTP
ncbi:MAG: DUF3006 domain-containing protein [Filifactoraceae bacterium]